MACEIIIVEEDYSENRCFSLCACGCERPIFKGDRVFQTDLGLFLIGFHSRRPKWNPKYYTKEKVARIIKRNERALRMNEQNNIHDIKTENKLSFFIEFLKNGDFSLPLDKIY